MLTNNGEVKHINGLSKAFGKDTAFTLGLIFLPIIFYPMLAFGNAKYIYSDNDRLLNEIQEIN